MVRTSSRVFGERILVIKKVSYHVHSLRGGNKEPEKRTDISLPRLSGNEDGVCSASKIAQVMVSNTVL